MEQDATVAADRLIIQLDEDTELRPFDLEDAAELYAVIDRNRERLHRWLPWATRDYSIQQAREFVARQAAEPARSESPAMTIRRRGSLCGAIALHAIDRQNKSTSIGYWIDEAHEGKGITTAACRAIITLAFQTFGLHRVEIRCATWNHRSSSIPRRLEFVEEGILREAWWLHDKWVDLRVFSMLAQDWHQ